MRRSIDCKLFCWSNGGKKWYHDNNPKNWFASIHGDLWLPQVSNGDGHMAQSLILQSRKITDFRWKDMFQGTRYVCTYMILGFVCLMLGKNSKHILPDGGFDGDLPWYQVTKTWTHPRISCPYFSSFKFHFGRGEIPATRSGLCHYQI